MWDLLIEFEYKQGPQVAFGDIGALVALGLYARSRVAGQNENAMAELRGALLY